MAETLSPNPTLGQKQRTPMASRIQSPTSPFFLGSNDDKLERAQARAARAAAIRRRTIVPPPSAGPQADPCLGKDQILELFQNCIKLASENKINQKNTWELGLIDHLCEIIKVEEEDDTETNFQKASCTLEAGVKIYSMRVDSVHSEAYKVLGGINRAGQENEQDSMAEDANVNNEPEGHPKKEQEKKMSPLSTLESSFEALNVKKFDVAFAVDPLYHQTSAQFDEGGAKGLLLNNLGIYGECRVLFDSQEVPGRCILSEANPEEADSIDLSAIADYIEKMVLGMRMKDEIAPTLRAIINQFDEDNRRPADTFSSGNQMPEQADASDANEVDWDDDAYQNCGNFDHDDQTSVVDEDFNQADPYFSTNQEENRATFQNLDTDDRFEKVDGFVLLGLGLTSRQNAWAGPDHWKYRKTEGTAKENGEVPVAKRPKKKKQAEHDIDFTKSWDADTQDVFAPPKNPKSLLLPANREPCNTRLPEDCHYQPENLVKLFLLPNIMCLGRRRRPLDEPRQEFNDDGPLPSWDDQTEFGGHFDEGTGHSDVEDSNVLVSQPRQVNKIEVQYDKTSKQVDVQALKETLWNCLEESTTSLATLEGAVSFKNILASITSNCRAAAAREDISPHLCFICLLHLANEHGLCIKGSANLDDLSIRRPTRQETSEVM